MISRSTRQSVRERAKFLCEYCHSSAEVLVPTQLSLQPALKFIACRSVAERQTLLQLLPRGLANRWLPRIRLGQMGLFERSWTYVEKVAVSDERVMIRFNPNTKTPVRCSCRPFYRSFC